MFFQHCDYFWTVDNCDSEVFEFLRADDQLDVSPIFAMVANDGHVLALPRKCVNDVNLGTTSEVFRAISDFVSIFPIGNL